MNTSVFRSLLFVGPSHISKHKHSLPLTIHHHQTATSYQRKRIPAMCRVHRGRVRVARSFTVHRSDFNV